MCALAFKRCHEVLVTELENIMKSNVGFVQSCRQTGLIKEINEIKPFNPLTCEEVGTLPNLQLSPDTTCDVVFPPPTMMCHTARLFFA